MAAREAGVRAASLRFGVPSRQAVQGSAGAPSHVAIVPVLGTFVRTGRGCGAAGDGNAALPWSRAPGWQVRQPGVAGRCGAVHQSGRAPAPPPGPPLVAGESGRAARRGLPWWARDPLDRGLVAGVGGRCGAVPVCGGLPDPPGERGRRVGAGAARFPFVGGTSRLALSQPRPERHPGMAFAPNGAAKGQRGTAGRGGAGKGRGSRRRPCVYRCPVVVGTQMRDGRRQKMATVAPDIRGRIMGCPGWAQHAAPKA